MGGVIGVVSERKSWVCFLIATRCDRRLRTSTRRAKRARTHVTDTTMAMTRLDDDDDEDCGEEDSAL